MDEQGKLENIIVLAAPAALAALATLADLAALAAQPILRKSFRHLKESVKKSKRNLMEILMKMCRNP